MDNIIIAIITGLIALGAIVFFFYQMIEEKGKQEGIDLMQEQLNEMSGKILALHRTRKEEIETSLASNEEMRRRIDEWKGTYSELTKDMNKLRDLLYATEISRNKAEEELSRARTKSDEKDLKIEGLLTTIKDCKNLIFEKVAEVDSLESKIEKLKAQPCSHDKNNAAEALVKEMEEEGFFNFNIPKKKTKKVKKNAKTTKRKK